MGSFSADITKFVEKTKLKGSTVLRKIALDTYSGVLLRSPVKTGRFRASHRIGVNKVDPTVEAPRTTESELRIGTAMTGAEQAGATRSLQDVEWGDTIHITNNLPYAKKLEDGGSRQNGNRPDGIYGATFAEVSGNLANALRSLGP